MDLKKFNNLFKWMLKMNNSNKKMLYITIYIQIFPSSLAIQVANSTRWNIIFKVSSITRTYLLLKVLLSATLQDLQAKGPDSVQF